MFLTGPRVVREALGEEIGDGGPRRPAACTARNGVCHLVAADDGRGDRAGPPAARPAAAADRRPAAARRRRPRPTAADPGATVPAEPRKVYDVRDVAAAILDARQPARALAALGARTWSPAIARHRRPPGRADRQPAARPRRRDRRRRRREGGALRRPLRPLRLPLVVFVDTPGFMPGRARRRRA